MQQSGQSAQSTPGGTDYSNSGSSNKAETMKQCMARQKATNSGMTHEAMQTTCKNEMKQQKLQQQGQDFATGTQNGSQTHLRLSRVQRMATALCRSGAQLQLANFATEI